jgi:hypothetical protein
MKKKEYNTQADSVVSILSRLTQTGRKGSKIMFPFWIVLGTVLILAGIFNRQILGRLGLRPLSESITVPNLKYSTKSVEQIGRWLLITLGISFLVLGLGDVLPDGFSSAISYVLLGLAALMLLAMIGITIANWKAR